MTGYRERKITKEQYERAQKNSGCGTPVSYGVCVKGNIEWLKQDVIKDAETD